MSRELLRRGVWLTAAATLVTLALDVADARPLDGLRALSIVLAHALIVWALFAVARVLPGTQRERGALLFVLLLVVGTVNLALELVVFSTAHAALPRFLVEGCAWSLAFAAAGARWAAPSGAPALDWRAPGTRFTATGWLWRGALAVLTYVLLYLVVGGIAFEFTRPYYTDPVWGLGLTLPPVGEVIALQFLRGALFVVALTGLLLAPVRHGWRAGLALAVVGGLAPLLLNAEWPAALRVYHGVEILAQNLPTGLAIVALLGARPVPPPAITHLEPAHVHVRS